MSMSGWVTSLSERDPWERSGPLCAGTISAVALILDLLAAGIIRNNLLGFLLSNYIVFCYSNQN